MDSHLKRLKATQNTSVSVGRCMRCGCKYAGDLVVAIREIGQIYALRVDCSSSTPRCGSAGFGDFTVVKCRVKSGDSLAIRFSSAQANSCTCLPWRK